MRRGKSSIVWGHMRTITHYEVYAAKRGRWTLLNRVMEKEQNIALDTA